ncbi:hypothetical protein U1Q18_049709 [Sarracenia purpurea var. burkii]
MGMVSMLVIETVAVVRFSLMIMNWVNDENPEGKPMMGQGRISKMIIAKVNYFLTTVFYPLFFFWVGTEADLSKFDADHVEPWARLFFLFLIATTGKVVGTMISGVMLGFHWPESVAIGLLLNIKGHFHVYLAIIAAKHGDPLRNFLNHRLPPLVVANIIERARKRSPTQRMALQWLDPTDDLRILLCLHSPQNISRGTTDPGMMVFVTDMIKLTNRIAATLGHIDGVEAVMVTDPTVMDMREEIMRAMEGYVEVDGEGISVRRMLVLATLNDMHQDICIIAE